MSFSFLSQNPSSPTPPLSLQNESESLPDVARTSQRQSQSQNHVSIQWVGMKGIDLPLVMQSKNNGGPDSSRALPLTLPIDAQADVWVSLDDPLQRGIHMSRLYTLLRDGLSLKATEQLDGKYLQALLTELKLSQAGLSNNIKLKLRFSHWLRQQALVSEEWGWRKYPVEIEMVGIQDAWEIRCQFEVLYSSTCPASFALARHDWQQRLNNKIEAGERAGDMESWATPHAQRSRAQIELKLSSLEKSLNWTEWILVAEDSLGTPVQTAVRRPDEQAFARLNGQNPLFCEDAARRLWQAFHGLPEVDALKIKVIHYESLHPHDVSAEINWTRSS